MRRFWLPAGLAACLTLGATAEVLAVSNAAMPASIPVAPPTAPRTSVAPVISPLWASAILARPLFRADRRPLVIAAAQVDDSLPRLSAIVVTANGRSAVFASADGAPNVIVTGGRIGAYSVQHIAPDSVSLTGPNGAIKVHPQYAPASAIAAAPPVPPVPSVPLPQHLRLNDSK